jgi:c(7)-type cytochrome triheme protein
MKRMGFAVIGLALISVSLVAAQTFGVRKRAPKPDEFGNVVMSNYAARIDSDPVVFPHWLHRAKFTCRLCHVDLGFSMVAQETDVKESDNQNGLYCGACHNGTMAFAAEESVVTRAVRARPTSNTTSTRSSRTFRGPASATASTG